MLGKTTRKTRWQRFALLLPVTMFVAGAALAVDPLPPPPTGDGHLPTLVSGNPTCEDLGLGDFEYKFDNDPRGTITYCIAGTTNCITINANTGDVDPGHLLSWSSTFGIDAVIMKGGQNGANVYVYNPEDTGDTNLYTPRNDNETFAGISHINFCYDKELTVTKTATPKFDRTYTWDIFKSGAFAGTPDGTAPDKALVLQPGQSILIGYTVEVGTTGYTDGNFSVEGKITVTNSWDVSAVVTGVSDTIGGVPADSLTCPDFNVTLGPGEYFECTYSDAREDGTPGTNTATATTDGSNGIGGASGTADFAFVSPTNSIDECVDVTDTLQGVEIELTGSPVCIGVNEPKTFTYNRFITQGATDETCLDSVTNRAEFLGQDTDASDYALATIYLDKEFCETFDEGGCTLTIGYWKTHSKYGPAPYDDTWSQAVFNEDTAFFSSGKTYYEVFWTSPAGNAYYNLAHQYIGAKLNGVSGASAPAAVTTAINDATTLFGAYTPAQIAGLSGNNALRKQFIALAGLLEKYNSGATVGGVVVGPGHCSE